MSLFVPSLKESGQLEQVHMTVCIVGSRKLLQGDDYGSGPWGLLAPNLTIYGFDADADACEVANAEVEARQINWTEKHIPLALAKSEGESTLYVTKSLDCSSLYAPNEPYIKRLNGFRDSLQLEFTVELETTTLDTFCQSEGIEEIDFLQVDVQGAELDVLAGASVLLESTILGVQAEVEFSQLYANQPLFADVDPYLRKRGFVLFDLLTDHYWCRSTRACSPVRSPARAGQLIWADACYFRDPIREDAKTVIKEPKRILKLACIADILGFPDYTLELLEYLTVQHGDDPQYNFARNIIETLSKFPELVNQGLDSLAVVANIRDRLN
ncbi:MAG: FkbM family methyltransferase [Symploca sp. SIO2C1]|nr:FkbM family methyltransferase [Symploca sp. SIO2C1]